MTEEHESTPESKAPVPLDVNADLSGGKKRRPDQDELGRWIKGNTAHIESNAVTTAMKGKHFRTLFKEAMDREGKRRGQSLIEYCVECAYEDRAMAMLLCKALIEPQKPGTAISVEVENQVAVVQQAEQAKLAAKPTDMSLLTPAARSALRVVLKELRANHPGMDGPKTDEERRLPVLQGPMPGEKIQELGLLNPIKRNGEKTTRKRDREAEE
jgi:hypothetical protein